MCKKSHQKEAFYHKQMSNYRQQGYYSCIAKLLLSVTLRLICCSIPHILRVSCRGEGQSSDVWCVIGSHGQSPSKALATLAVCARHPAVDGRHESLALAEEYQSLSYFFLGLHQGVVHLVHLDNAAQTWAYLPVHGLHVTQGGGLGSCHQQHINFDITC